MNTTQQQAQSQSLFRRLGGESGIRALVDDIFQAHLENPTIQARFEPVNQDPERRATVKRRLCEFMAAGTGGPEHYTGKSMPETHRGMNVSEAEFVAAVDDILGVLANHQLSERTQNDVLVILYSLKDEIVHE